MRLSLMNKKEEKGVEEDEEVATQKYHAELERHLSSFLFNLSKDEANFIAKKYLEKWAISKTAKIEECTKSTSSREE